MSKANLKQCHWWQLLQELVEASESKGSTCISHLGATSCSKNNGIMVGLSLEPFAVGDWCIWLCHPNFLHTVPKTLWWSDPKMHVICSTWPSVNTHTLHLGCNLELLYSIYTVLPASRLFSHLSDYWQPAYSLAERMKKPAIVVFKRRCRCRRPHHHHHHHHHHHYHHHHDIYCFLAAMRFF